jgi:hypothetical protein
VDRHRKETQIHCLLLPGPDLVERDPCVVPNIMIRSKVESLRNNPSINKLDV